MQPHPKIHTSYAHTFERKETMTAADIATLLNMKVETFLKRRHTLFIAGMPRPIPGTGRTWSRRNVMAWIDGAGAMQALPGTAKDPVELAREGLEARMGGVR